MRNLLDKSRIVIGVIRDRNFIYLRVFSDRKGFLYLVEYNKTYTPFLNYDEALNYMVTL